MSVTKLGLIFDNPTEAAAFSRVAKAELYASGWKWTGRFWRLVERRKPGKLLIIELPNWAEAYDWEMLMQNRACVSSGGTGRGAGSPPNGGDET